MSLEDRDWYREDFKEKEKKYGSDFGAAKKRQEAADAMWAEVEPSRSGGGIPPKKPTKTMTAEPPANGDDVVIVPGVCTGCGASVNVQVKRKELSNYSYVCPKCGQKVTVTSKSVAKSDGMSVLIILASLVISVLLVYGVTNYVISGAWLVSMLLLNLVMLIYIFAKKPATSSAMRTGAFICFLFSEWIVGITTYAVFFAK